MANDSTNLLFTFWALCWTKHMIMKPSTAYIKLKHKIMLLIEFKQIKAEIN